jgi:hypothetical protein
MRSEDGGQRGACAGPAIPPSYKGSPFSHPAHLAGSMVPLMCKYWWRHRLVQCCFSLQWWFSEGRSQVLIQLLICYWGAGSVPCLYHLEGDIEFIDVVDNVFCDGILLFKVLHSGRELGDGGAGFLSRLGGMIRGSQVVLWMCCSSGVWRPCCFCLIFWCCFLRRSHENIEFSLLYLVLVFPHQAVIREAMIRGRLLQTAVCVVWVVVTCARR